MRTSLNNRGMLEAGMVTLKGSLDLQIDEGGLEAGLIFTPDPDGAEWDTQKVSAYLGEKGVVEGIDAEALNGLFDPKEKPPAGRVVVARGTAPQGAKPAQIVVDPAEGAIPEELKPFEDRVIPKNTPPRVFLRTVDIKKSEKVVTKKPLLPFLRARKERQVVREKEEIIRAAEPAGSELGRGYTRAGKAAATVTPAERARAGRSVLGREIPAAQTRGEEGELLLGEGLRQVGNEIRAEQAGFFRYGANWIELFPFALHEHRVYASANQMTCLLDFTPGSEQAPPPSAEQVLEECGKLGFSPETLLDEEEAALLLSRALTDGTVLEAGSLSRTVDGECRLTVSEDRLRATLFLRKARGERRPLDLKKVGETIRSYRLKGMNAQRVREDILAFHRGKESSLSDYPLVEGREAGRGEDGHIEWKVTFLKAERAQLLKEEIRKRADQMGELESLEQFTLEAVEQMAEVAERMPVAVIYPATAGQPGVDVFGTGLPGIKGKEIRVSLFENLQQLRNEIITLRAGLLEKGNREDSLLLRVRPHRDREIQVVISEDRMQAFLTLLPSEGTGKALEAGEVEQAIAGSGPLKGILSEEVSRAVAEAKQGHKVDSLPIARGQEPEHGRDTDLEIVVQQASGQSVTVNQDGRADYRRQDKITTVAAGTLLARQPAPTAGQDGWDVTGKAIPARRGSARYVHTGKNVEGREEEDGTIGCYSKIEGELLFQGGSLDVLRVHTVNGNVGLGTGNVRFPGTVRVAGSVQSGFHVMADESILVGESVQGALLSAGDSIEVEKGIVGEGKAVLRAKKSIRARFAEQATLLAVENIRFTNACLRCTVKCNGRMVLESEKGNVIGGRVCCKLGLVAMNIGSEREVATEIFFGQDILVQDQLEREQRQSDKLKERNEEIERSMSHLTRVAPSDLKGLEKLRSEKRRNLQLIQMHSKRIFILQERFEQHFPSEIVVRGVVYPGVVLKSHNRQREIKTPLREVVFFFNTASGRIEEKPLSE